jgi:hypothetical protein
VLAAFPAPSVTRRMLPSTSPWAYFACAVAVTTCCCKPAGPKTYSLGPSPMTVPSPPAPSRSQAQMVAVAPTVFRTR